MVKNSFVYIVGNDDESRTLLCSIFATVGLSVFSHSSVEDFLNSFDPALPGCVLVDLRMPVMGGLELLKHLNKIPCDLPVIILSGHGDVETAVEAMKLGAFDFIKKPFSGQHLLEKVQEAVRYSIKSLFNFDQREEIKKNFSSLSFREKQILTFVVSGAMNKEISDVLNISVKTVEIHRSQMRKKMVAMSLADLINKARELELLTVPFKRV